MHAGIARSPDRQFCYLEKRVLEVHQAATLEPRKIERSIFFPTGPQRTNLNLQASLRSNGGLVPEKSLFSDREGHLAPPPSD